nr:acyltransferase family protein [uncultured Fusobacterium sp.]
MESLNKRSVGIDIIKALSLISVIIYHLYEYQGTYIGVVLFFVISGYLITEVLYERDDSYFKFIQRRYTKIFPPLIVVLVSSCLAFYYFYGYLSEKLVMNSISSLFGLSNFYQVMSGLSYFEKSGDLFPLLHTWSLSIEIQFYIFFPFLIYFLKKINMKKEIIAVLLVILSLISAGAMAYKNFVGYDLSNIYYGTDTRIFSILIGSAFYFIFKDRELEKNKINTISYILLAFIIIATLLVDYSTAANYYGLLYLISLAGGFITVASVKTGFLDFQNNYLKPLSKLGEHSYVYYLWQYPIMIFSLEYFKWSDIDYNYTVILQTIILIILSEVSYKLLIEWKRESTILRRIFLVIYGAILYFVPISTETNSQEVKNQIEINEKAKVLENNEKAIKQKNQENLTNDNEQDKTEDYLEARLLNDEKIEVVSIDIEEKSVQNIEIKKDNTKSDEKSIAKKEENLGNKKVGQEKDKINSNSIDGVNYTFVGDSVMKMGEPYIKELFRDSTVDAKVSRQFVDLPKILDKLQEDKKLKKVVVIHLGTNGVINKKSFEKSMEYLKDKKVYIVNTVVPKPWEKSVNKDLEEWSADYNNIKIIDWHKYAKGEKDLFFKDATHPKPDGAKKYAEFILKNIKE